ncbi:MAG: hypothetical protein CSA84_01460 [Actinomycetales bacterium]|nr:MAG: hypothetical protein CSA84_01460 [Actinomycetales bacterium]
MSHGESLTRWPLGRPANVTGVGEDRDFELLLGHVGLRPGMTLTPVLHTPGRGVVVAVGDLRLALDRSSAASVFVCSPGDGT